MPDTTLRIRYPAGATLYTQIEAPDGTMWNGSAYATFSVPSWAAFATATPETPASSGRYACQFPTSSAAGNYNWATYFRSGGSPASGDVCVGTGSGFWDGTTFGATASVQGSVTGSVASVSGNVGGNVVGSVGSVVSGIAVADLPDPAPDGYGPIGTGSVAVDHNYPTPNSLKFQTGGGQGIGGALVRAYLAGEYTSNPATATIRGQTLTLDSGLWANVIDLDPGDYRIVFKAEGYETAVVPLTVT